MNAQQLRAELEELKAATNLDPPGRFYAQPIHLVMREVAEFCLKVADSLITVQDAMEKKGKS